MEVLIKIGDSGGYTDGQIIAVKPDGWLISALDMKAWIDEGKEPTVLADMPEYQVNRLKRRVNRMRWELSHTAAEIATEFKCDEVSDAAIRKEHAESDRTRMVTLGLDTNWGYEDLKTHFAVRVAQANDHDYKELADMEIGTDHLAAPIANRRYRVAYEAQFDAAALADIRNAAKRIEVDREHELPRAALVATTAKGVS